MQACKHSSLQVNFPPAFPLSNNVIECRLLLFRTRNSTIFKDDNSADRFNSLDIYAFENFLLPAISAMCSKQHPPPNPTNNP